MNRLASPESEEQFGLFRARIADRLRVRLTARIEFLKRAIECLDELIFVGGHLREEHRQRIQEALELEALEWPETDRFDSNPNELAADVRRSEIVVLLIRFMRSGMKRASDLCREQGKPVVRLPRGLNVARVVTDFHQQLLFHGAAQ